MDFVKSAEFGEDKYSCQRVCRFCYKIGNVSRSRDPENDGNVQLFFKLLERFVGEDLRKKAFGKFSDREKILVGCCEDCECFISSFCDLFHQVKCLELQLQWKLGTLVNIMKLANGVPSRLQHLKRILQESGNFSDGEGHDSDNVTKNGEEDDVVEKKLKDFKSFRNRMMRKCSRKLSHSLPRVSLWKVVDDDVDTSTINAQGNRNLESGFQRFLGWLLSFTAVATLMASSSPPKGPPCNYNLAEEALQIDDIWEVDNDNEACLEAVDANTQEGDSDVENASEIDLTSEDNVEEPDHTAEDAEMPHLEFDEVPETPAITERGSSSVTNEKPPIKLIDTISSQDSQTEVANEPGNRKDEKESNYSDSSSSSDTSDSDDGTEDKEQKTRQKRKRGRRGNSAQPRCSLDGCDVTFRNSKKYEEHQNFHAPGEYKCNFRDAVEQTVVRLGLHELTNHSRNEEPCSSSKKQVISCPRCPLETAKMWLYKAHFAKVHIPGFAQFSWFGRRAKHLENRVRCEMCQLRIRRGLEGRSKVSHFKRWHDPTGVESKYIVQCDMEGCSVFFTGKNGRVHLAKDKLREHKMVAYEYTPPSKIKRNNDEIKSTMKPEIRKLGCPEAHCGLKFRVQKDLDTHRKLHGRFPCKFCDVVKNYAPDLALHETEHAVREKKETNKIYSCSRCPVNKLTKGWYISHFVETHIDLSSKTDTCPICQMKGNAFLGYHMKAFHKTEGLDPSDIFKCDQCPAYFIKREQLVVHTLTIHYQNKCPVCGKTEFRDPKGIRNHKDPNRMRIHIVRKDPEFTGLRNLLLTCDVGNCRATFVRESDLERHKKEGKCAMDYDKVFQCAKCNREFKGQLSLKMHMYNAHEEPRHVCEECGKAFRQKAQLNQHILHHKGPDSWGFHCSTCGKKFHRKSTLQMHQRSHTKEKPWVCEVCGQAYSKRQDWRNHLKSKHKEKYDEMGLEGKWKPVNERKLVSRKGIKKGQYVLSRDHQ